MLRRPHRVFAGHVDYRDALPISIIRQADLYPTVRGHNYPVRRVDQDRHLKVLLHRLKEKIKVRGDMFELIVNRLIDAVLVAALHVAYISQSDVREGPLKGITIPQDSHVIQVVPRQDELRNSIPSANNIARNDKPRRHTQIRQSRRSDRHWQRTSR